MNNRNKETAKDEGISLKRRLNLRHFCFSLLHPDRLCVRARVKIFMGVGVGVLGWERQHKTKTEIDLGVTLVEKKSRIPRKKE